VREGGGFVVRDVGSLNGTYLNRERIEAAGLAGGDEVQIGKYRLVFLAGLAGARRERWSRGRTTAGRDGARAGVHEHRRGAGAAAPRLRRHHISKIRFLESEGLVEPERTASGYRKFSREDLSRLRYVLTAQRDHYLPLRVIKEHLEAIDRGLEPPALSAGGPKVPRALVMAEGMPGPDAFLPDVTEVRLSRKELLTAAGLAPEQLDQLEQHGLLRPRAGGSHYDGDALVVAKTVAEMARFGIEARHLRPFRAAA
jgi:DNA-binding transcriptional MerR regulator